MICGGLRFRKLRYVLMWCRIAAFTALLACLWLPACAEDSTPGQPESPTASNDQAPQRRVVVLGTAQDAGLPHIGCEREHCEQARADGRRARVASLAVVGHAGWWLLDATPDLPAQIAEMGSLPRGILLTHAHIGHYTGLMYLGREAWGGQGIEVLCSERLAEFLRSNGPWSQLVKLGNIELRPFTSEQHFDLEPGLTVTPHAVPHRDEFSDTHGFLIESDANRSLLFLPDIDQWDRWTLKIEDFLVPNRRLYLDGTFWSGAELPNRDISEIPHPLVSSSIERLRERVAETGAQVSFIHLNHSNPLWNRQSEQARQLRAAGFFLAERGESHTL